MPSGISFQCGVWEVAPHKWERCLSQARKEMLAAGWSQHSRKFRDVQHKKAAKLFEL